MMEFITEGHPGRPCGQLLSSCFVTRVVDWGSSGRAQMDLHYLLYFSLARLLPGSTLEGLILERMPSQGMIVKAVAHVWFSSPFWLVVALYKLPIMLVEISG